VRLGVTSPWDGASRAPLRRVLGALMAFDVVLGAWFVSSLRPGAVSHPHAPGWLLALGSNMPALGVIACVGLAASAQFARRAGQVAWGLVALVAVGLLVEAQGALLEGPMRFLFFSGAALTGWLAGLVFARWQGLDARDPDEADRCEAFAEQGAVSVLAACYANAFVGKLLSSGVSWVVDGGLQATIAAQHSWGQSAALDALATITLEHAWLTSGLAAFTLIAQGSAVLLPFSRRGRAVSASLLLAFHTGVWLLTPISFPQAMVLLLAFGFPWPAWVARLRGKAPPAEGVAPGIALPGAVWRAGCAVAAVVALAWLLPISGYTQLHHKRSVRPEASAAAPVAAPLSATARAWLEGIDEGSSVLEFRIAHLTEAEPGIVCVELVRGDQRMVAEVVPHGTRPFSAPRSTRHFDLFYRRLTPAQRPAPEADQIAALGALAARLARREELPDFRPPAPVRRQQRPDQP
jgi:hypothetical protein